MEKKSFTLTVAFEKPIQDIFKHLTYDVASWWGGKDLTGNSIQLNDEFIIHHPGAHCSKQKVVEVIPNKKVVWLVTESKLDWLEKDQAEWTGTKMIFELTTEGDKTVIHFTHEGLVPEMECYDRVAQGWNMVIKELLFNFIATGQTI